MEVGLGMIAELSPLSPDEDCSASTEGFPRHSLPTLLSHLTDR